MGITRSMPGRKAPSQSQTSFFEGNQQGGAYGSSGAAPKKPASGSVREKIYGKPVLDKVQKT